MLGSRLDSDVSQCGPVLLLILWVAKHDESKLFIMWWWPHYHCTYLPITQH